MDMSKYVGIFVSESQEHLQRMDDLLLALERASDDAGAIAALFREAHSMKGMSASMGYEGVARVAHRLEDFLDQCRQGRTHIGGEALELLFEGVDILRQAVHEIRERGAPSVDVTAFLQKLVAPGRPAPPPPAGEADERSRLVELLAEAPPEVFAGSGPALALLVDIAPDAPMPAARAYVTLRKLGDLGTILISRPTLDQVQAGEFEGSLAVLLASQRTPGAIHREVSGWPDVANVLLEALEGGEPAARPPARAAADLEVVAAAGGEPGLGLVEEPALPMGPPAVPAPAQPGPEVPTVQAAPAPPAAGVRRAEQQMVRVDTRLLDQLLDHVGELITAKGSLLEESRDATSSGLRDAVGQVERLVGSLQRQALKLRMMPFEVIADRFPRAVRDLAHKSGKEVDFRLIGKEIEMDRSILDHLGDPLVHILRNAVDHGIEPPEERERLGKSRAGRLTLRAAEEGESVFLQFEDDGRGMDPDHLRRAAVGKGLLTAEQAAALSDVEALELITRPGFSTADRVTDVSGRGVGMDVVKTIIEGLHGSLLIESVPGEGSTFTLKLPLSLAVISVLLVRVGSERYAVPMYQVGTTIEVDEGDIQRAQGQEVVGLDGELVPLLRLGRALGCPPNGGAPRQDGAGDRTGPLYAVLTEVHGRDVGMVVDEILGVRDVLVKPLGKALRGLRGFAGLTILGDGSVVLILDVNGL
ncbi:MAG TPA: chemotaxis protein CheA [Candidatus Sulfotelmatobacter sp.]|nr:chemotaxis protein CheA [Candidatus Sulfotelmatobacter sp.]